MADEDTVIITDSDDTVTETTRQGWLGRLGGSVAGAFIGFLMLVGSIVLLSWNEGRAVDAITALNAGAKAVQSVPADAVQPANEGRLVHVSGPATVPGRLNDPVFNVGHPSALRLERTVEMYQWRQNEESKSEKSVGGSETTTTTYRYVKEWSERPIDSSAFKRPDGHRNPSMPYRSAAIEARGARLGAFALDPSLVKQVSAFERLAPDSSAVLPQGFSWVGEQLYRGASPDQPQVGDVRVGFRVVPVQTLSVVGAQMNGTLTGFPGERGQTINLVETGARSADTMFQHAKSDENTLTWILRAVGFFVMLFGVLFMASPILWLASLLPFLESLVGAAAFGMAVVVSVPLTLTVVAVAWLAHRPLVGAGLIVAGIVLAVLIRRVLPSRKRVAATA
ncbi:TMEM43 family protein [Azospirillum sp. TSO22-1]|uniref:TMEM43 family protein n=1 Tax=Azospirillum sp. TSO22-1 TaxID=716789 RepID=UPI000D6146D7|nr:TMEM43 family protein [Azospirillum sp. TSO22-1]PWC35565.1 hypothetical protein TSO221_29315 [Azospirillum sp. TSO22-1]